MRDKLVRDKLFYAIEAVLYIAYNAGNGAVSARDIAALQGVADRYLEGLLQKLVRAGILRGIRGPKGGYVLAKERRKVSLADICTALVSYNDDIREIARATSLGSEIIAPLWEKAESARIAAFAQTTLADLCEEADRKKLKKISEEKTDFAI